MYRWRKMNDTERADETKRRQMLRLPMHSPRHHDGGRRVYLITAACYEHRPFIGCSEQRMDDFSGKLLSVAENHCEKIDAWVVLPNHYHLLALTDGLPELLKSLGKLHGRTSRAWNGEDDMRGRKVWFNAVERPIQNDRHHLVAIQYIHHNPVKHGQARKWTDWRWSSAVEYIERIGREEAERRWRECPLQYFGKGWDD
jgi:putative transposase